MTTQQVTPTKFLELYSKRLIHEPVNVKIGTEQRVYGRTTDGQASNPEGYKIVYAVVT